MGRGVAIRRPSSVYTGGSGTDPYPFYPTFDRNTIPWHTAAGSWGPQYAITAPTAPTTTRSVTVNSIGNTGTPGTFDYEANISGTQITIGTSFAENTIATIRGDDIRVIVPPSIAMGGIQIGDTSNFPVQINPHRVAIIGALDGSRGGRVGQIRAQCIAPDLSTDLIVDGVDVNGAGSFSPNAEQWQGFRGNVTRAFIHNVRGISPGYFAQAGGINWVIANTTMFAGASTRTDVGYVEGWGWRSNAGPLYFIDCDLQTTRYHVLRPHTDDGAGEYFYVKNCRIINLAEGQMIWGWNRLSEPAFGYGFATVVEDSFLYSGAQSGCGNGDSQVISLNTCTYSRIRRNTLYSNGTGNRENRTLANLTADRDLAISLANADSTLISRGRAPLPSDAHSSDSDISTNSVATLTGHPGWRGPGDPRSVPLPSGFTLAEGEGTCPAIWT